MPAAKFIFLGTGTSERVPRVTCVSRQPVTCAVCADAMRLGSKNRRRNTSLLIQTEGHYGATVNIVIDAGKSFYEGCVELFPRFGVAQLNAVVLTHAHADAVAGLDDLRDWTMNTRSPMPLYVRSVDMPMLSKSHFYLLDKSLRMSGGGVADIDIIETDEETFDVHGVEFIPLPVEHGPGFTSNGYRIGDVCYMPDVSKIPDPTLERMAGCKVLVLDALRRGRTHGSHLTLEEAVDVVRMLRPSRTIFTDMTHDIEHESTNAELARLKESDGLEVELAYDGMWFESEL